MIKIPKMIFHCLKCGGIAELLSRTSDITNLQCKCRVIAFYLESVIYLDKKGLKKWLEDNELSAGLVKP